MTPGAWEALAVQAPVVLIFAAAVYLLLKQQAATTRQLTDTFMAFLEKRDAALDKSLQRIAECLDQHEAQTREHDAFMRERLKEKVPK